MFDDDKDKWDDGNWDMYGYMYDETEGVPRKTSPTPFIVFALLIIVIHLIGGSTYSTPISWIGIIVLFIMRFSGMV